MTSEDSQQSKIGVGQEDVVAEFRANGGKVGGYFADMSLLLLTAVGAKSGVPQTVPLTYVADGDRYLVFAAANGAPKHPAWFHNLVAHPEVTIEVGKESFPAEAVVVTDAKREQLLDRFAGLKTVIERMQAKTTRVIPAVVFLRR
jgi:deazaflavin-dependent oxidoreductase (nitroreductase family)